MLQYSKAFTGGERVGLGEREVEQLLRGERAMRLGHQRVLKFGGLGVVEQPALHPGQLPQRDLVTFGDAVDELGDRIVQPQLALVSQLQHPGHGECLCLATDSAVDVGFHRRASRLVGDTESADVAALGSPDTDDRAGDIRRCHGLVDGGIEPRATASFTGLADRPRRRRGTGGRCLRRRDSPAQPETASSAAVTARAITRALIASQIFASGLPPNHISR